MNEPRRLEEMSWIEADIDGCVVSPLRMFTDERGWLMEFFRSDEIPGGNMPAMGYVSLTHPHTDRGPHEHREQSDLFVFFDGRFRLYLWDARPGSATFGHRTTLVAGRSNPCTVIVPPGVVHGYRNIDSTDALIINCPNRLYAGDGRRAGVDEIRYENQPDSPFQMN